MLTSSRLLIVEAQFLIALDIQRVVEDANARQAVMARSYDEVATLLEDRPADFDLVILTPPRRGTDDMSVARRLVEAGAAVVVCTAARLDLGGTPLAGAELVIKPFLDDELRDACRRALEKRAAG